MRAILPLLFLGVVAASCLVGAAGTLPPFTVARWVNSTPLAVDALRGKVVLLDVWEYTCINWIRTLPYVKAWHRDYAPLGLVVVGLHAPEFEFGKRADNIDRGIRDHGLTYPLALDNDFATWRALGNDAWPAKYLYDGQGRLVKRWVGEGRYDEIEAEIRRQLIAAKPGTQLPSTTTEVTSFARTGQPSYAGITNETYVGSDRREAGTFTLEGDWRSGRQYVELRKGTGKISLPFTAGEVNLVHPGADDNASGVAAVLAAAERLKNGPRGRNVAFVLWSGEEAGLLGSSAFTAKPPLPLDQIAAYFNFDMVGRLKDNALQVQGAGSSPAWSALATSANSDPTLKIAVQNDPNLPTDSSSFNQAGVPTLSFFTGSHEDYHRPTDTADRVDTDGIDRVVRYATTIVSRVADAAEPPAFAKVEPQTRGRGARDGIRLYTGTIPDYASETKGLLLGGVSAGGPAEQAGLMKGDIIVEIAGQSIANVYDYTYALDLMKADEPVKVLYLRNSEKRETTLTPRARR